MRPETREIEVKASIAAGAPIVVEVFRESSVQIGGTFVATIQIEGRLDSSMPWSPIGSPVTAPGFVDLPNFVTEIRANTTAHTSGTPTGFFGGFNARTD